VRLAGQGDVERLKQPGRAKQKPGRVAAATLIRSDVPAQALDLRGPQRVQRPGKTLGRDQQPQRRVQLAGLPLSARRGQQPLRPAAGFRR
jgi:hypothetical protein